ncbi:MAG: hypothetical protein ACFFDP_13625 [Promethearchaeota archaeon]
MATEIKKIGELLVLIGAIISLIIGILYIVNLGGYIFGLDLWSIGSIIPGIGLFLGIALIIISLITLATSGAIPKFPIVLEKNWIMLLILGIILIICGGGVGALLVIIGAILMLF